ncbi:MAG: cupin [Gammaproteobacteria bacterium]|nr:MAG: cupin [Gammaproteobacteria bacterium]
MLSAHGREAVHIGIDEAPWVPGDGVALQLLQVDLNQGLWVLRTRFAPGHQVETHYHTGPVFAVTHSGCWYYREYPDQVNKAGSYLFEPAHSVHTLIVPEDNTEDTEVWFAIYGANVNLDESGAITSILDAQGILTSYREGCAKLGVSCDHVIVTGA